MEEKTRTKTWRTVASGILSNSRKKGERTLSLSPPSEMMVLLIGIPNTPVPWEPDIWRLVGRPERTITIYDDYR